MTNVTERDRRWESEARYFDRVAAGGEIRPIRSKTLARYSHPWRTWLIPEYRLRLAGTLAGKRALDIGCGEGQSSVLLAKLGAHVTGIDIAPGAVESARKRAALDDVSSNTAFVCGPLETCDLPDGSFDLIWCQSFLHHVIDDLPAVLDRIHRWLAPGGRAIISEPVSLSRWFRQFRLAFFRAPDATEDERPLEPSEIALIRRTFQTTSIRYFGLFGRLDQFVLSDGYEYSSSPRRALSNALRLTDRVVLSLPVIRRLASVAVIGGFA
ncbi:MAG TPA: methyltransferase domain-containing protein [Gemmatimonadaceae bacterium]